MSRLNIPNNPILPGCLEHHILSLNRKGSIIESPDVGASALVSLCVPTCRRTRTLERGQAVADARQYSAVCLDRRYVMVHRRLWISASDQICFFLGLG